MSATVDLHEAAATLGVHYQTAYGWVREGRLEARKVGARYIVEARSVDALARSRETSPPRREVRVRDWETQVVHFFDHLRTGDELRARAVVDRLRRLGPVVLGDRLFAPALRRIGEWWAAGELSVAEEHRATAICERLLTRAFGDPAAGRPRGVAVVAAAPGEGHGLPAAMAAAALRQARWRVHHLGPDVPASDLVDLAKSLRADLAVVSVTMPDRALAAQRVAGRLERAGSRSLVGRPGATLEELVESAKTVTARR